jgi:hypothetical protein
MMIRLLNKSIVKWITVWISLALLVGSTAPGYQSNGTALAGASEVIASYLPITWRTFPWRGLFGVEIGSTITGGSPILFQVTRLSTKWVRLGTRISWRQLQPNEGDPIQWGLLVPFENELRILQAANMTPIVIVNDYPAWATTERSPGVYSYCGPLRGDKFAAFANFTSQLANRYKTNEFNVHNWELGNEPDVDGIFHNVPVDSPFGCWGDVADPYYGGKHYGEMLKIATPAIKTADPLAQVWVGGLLLNSPNTTNPGYGRPELFLRGILEAGVGTDYSYFDVVPYHAYTYYKGQAIDYDNGVANSPWYGETWEGSIKGKTKFLREIMAPYGVQKPLFVDEISLTCPEEWFSFCKPPDENFLQAQANHLVRVQVRGIDAGVVGYTWYTLEGPGWRNGGLLDGNVPRPSYVAYQVLVQQLINTDYLAPVDYGVGIEAYAFRRGAQDIHVVWTKLAVSGLTILVPAGKFVEARLRDGMQIAPVLVNGNYQIPVGFSPIYVTRRP